MEPYKSQLMRTHSTRWRARFFVACLVGLYAIANVALGQTNVISPAAQQAHAQITSYDGPATCVACHQQQAQQMFGSLHYQEMADTPHVANIDGLAGKGSNGARVMNSYCGTPSTSSRATCATCHVGNGRIPSAQLTSDQLTNIDCLICHQDAYKRVPAPPYSSLSFPGTNGTTHTIQVVVEDATGFQFVPDTAKMTISILDAARTVHLPTRASCLRCHAGAGGSDGGKRGDMCNLSVNPSLASDFHMSPQGANLGCVNCHSVGGHRMAGRGVDLRPDDSTNVLTCVTCHTAQPHKDYNARDGNSRDLHATRVACQTCHIPAFAKDISTEMERSWLNPVFSMAACRGQGGWIPGDVRASNVMPTYAWFDGTSLANVLDQVPVQSPQGEYVLALPDGSVQSTNAKIYPMKLHRSNAARQDSTGLMIPHSTFAFFTSGDFAKAVTEGQQLSGLTGSYSVVPVTEYQTINHGVEVKANALQCGACHAAYTTGGPVRMNLQANLGYALKGTTAQVCSQCHSSRTASFDTVHSVHVLNRGYDCSSCHTFSRAERGLTRVAAYVPAAPCGPVATALSATQVKLVWADNSATEQGFRIERSLDGTTFAEIGIVSSNVTAATDAGLSAGLSYYYRVRAYNTSGNSGYSMVGRATTVANTTPAVPAAPTGLTASASSGRVTLAWTASSGATSYYVKRAMSATGPFSIIAAGVTATGYSDNAVVNGTTYYYVLSAVNTSGESSNSSIVSATPQSSVPAAPTGLIASASSERVTLAWTASSGATSYNVKRAASASGPFNTIAAGVTATGYSDTAVVNGTTYYYVVSAVNAGGESPNSIVVSATPRATTTTVLPPTELHAEPSDYGAIKLHWEQSRSANITKNKIYRATVSGGPYTLVATISRADSYRDSHLTRGKTYYYVVTAVDANGNESTYSRQAYARTR
jgi:fibronectin type 3 domain-containing protein